MCTVLASINGKASAECLVASLIDTRQMLALTMSPIVVVRVLYREKVVTA